MRLSLLALLASLAACAGPEHLSAVPVGTYLLVIGDEPNLAVHSPYSGHLEERWELLGNPTAMTLTRDGLRAVIARTGGLTVQPLFEDRMPQFHDLGATPTAVATIDRRTRAAVAVPGALLVVNLYTGKTLARHETGLAQPIGLVLNRASTQVLVAGADEAAHVNLGSGTVSAVPLPDLEVRALARRTGSEEVWLVGQGTFQVFDFNSGSVTALPYSGDAAGVSFGVAGTRALITDRAQRTLRSLVPGEDEHTQPILLPHVPGYVRVTPDGRFAFVALTEDEAVAVIDLESATMRGTFATVAHPSTIALTVSRGRTIDGSD